MKKFITTLIISALTIPAVSLASQKALISGSGWRSVAIVDLKSGDTLWEYPVEKYAESNSVCMTKDKNVAIANKRNAIVVNIDKEILWKFDVPVPEEVQSVEPLDNGNLLVGICGEPARLVELDKNGKLVKEIKFTLGKNIHGQLRRVIPSKTGTYFVTLYSGWGFMEIDDKGSVLAKYKMPMPTFGIAHLKNGNLVLSGDRGKVVEFDLNTKKIVRTIDSTNLNGAKLLFGTQVNELKNGNLLIGNWNGHSKDKTQPKLFEVDKDNNVVWKLTKDKNIKNISGVYVF